MAHNPTPTGKQFDGDHLAQILIRARSDAAFRDQLLRSPAEALKELGLSAPPKWLAFLKRLKPANFEEEIQHKIATDPEGEGEGQGEGQGEGVG